MRLLRLHVQGFKSFKDKTTINFDDNITGIVGPNGCGKSNIVDALFWVMGEQSAKHLRGKSMKDLIFAGSSHHSPASFAEVTLVLSNEAGKHIHLAGQVVKPKEIHLTRKLYRNGETEYRINSTQARLKDIQEVFMDTGAGAKSYSIIAQGEINRLVQAKPVERRAMIEEVAGITKFKMRKKESLRKIEKTQSNLNRLVDLKSEISKNLKALEGQAQKAAKAKTLREKIKKNELIINSHKELEFLQSYIESNEKLRIQSEELETLKVSKNQIEIDLQDKQLKRDDMSVTLDELQEEYNLHSKKLTAGEERLGHLIKALEDKRHQLEIRNNENEELQTDIQQRQIRLEKLRGELEQLNSLERDTAVMDEMQAQVDELLSALDEYKKALKDQSKEKQRVERLVQQNSQSLFNNTGLQENLSKDLKDIIEETDEIEKNSSNFSEQLEQQRKDLIDAKTHLDENLKKLNELDGEIKHKAQAYQQRDQVARNLSRELVQLESRRESLVEINESGQGLKEGTNKFIQQQSNETFKLFGRSIKVRDGLSQAVEVLLGEMVEALICERDSVDILYDWAQENPKLGLSYLWSTKTAKTNEHDGVFPLADATSLKDLVEFESVELQQSYAQLLSQFYVVDKLDEDALSRLHSADTSNAWRAVVSKGGEIKVSQEAGALCVTFPGEKSVGVVERNNLIDSLATQIKCKQEELEEIEQEVKSLADLIEVKKSVRGDLQRERETFNTTYISLKSSLESRETSLKGSNARLEILSKRRSEVSRRRLSLQEEEEKLLIEQRTLSEQLQSCESSLEELVSKVDNLEEESRTKRENLVQIQVKIQSFEREFKNLNSQIQDAESQLARYKDKMASNKVLVGQFIEEIEGFENDIVHLKQSNAELVGELEYREKSLSEFKEEVNQLLGEFEQKQNLLKEMNSKENKLEKSNLELELKLNKLLEDEELLVRDTFERYQINLRSSILESALQKSDFLEGLCSIDSMFLEESEQGHRVLNAEPYHFEKKFPGQVKEAKERFKSLKSEFNRLGEINWQAVEDYERQKLRYDFLCVQEQELRQSLHDLEVAIEHIDGKSKERFKEAYEAVNGRFCKVFPIIFGGGSARLEIVGDLDDPECGIEIIAQPPGKKMQNINLMSGGEKAMTAVSLIFSIFLVKPSPFCLLDEVDAPLDDANVGRFNELLREMSSDSQFILITHNKKTMELNDTLYGVTMQEPGISKAVSVELH